MSIRRGDNEVAAAKMLDDDDDGDGETWHGLASKREDRREICVMTPRQRKRERDRQTDGRVGCMHANKFGRHY